MSPSAIHVVVVGHGSTKRLDAALSTHALCRHLFDANRFGAVYCAFMKQDRKVSDLFSCLPDGIDVEVMPHFAAQGAFVEDRLASFLEKESSRFRSARLHKALGVHPSIAQHLVRKAKKNDIDDVIIVAHGSTLSAGPAFTAKNMSRDMEKQGVRTHVVFLSNTPNITDWRDLDLGLNVMVCPILAGRGTHLCEDVPNAFMLKETPKASIPYFISGHWVQFEYPLLDDQLLAEISLRELGTSAE
jgi:sirohydrochlorin ferrochelatase